MHFLIKICLNTIKCINSTTNFSENANILFAYIIDCFNFFTYYIPAAIYSLFFFILILLNLGKN